MNLTFNMVCIFRNCSTILRIVCMLQQFEQSIEQTLINSVPVFTATIILIPIIIGICQTLADPQANS